MSLGCCQHKRTNRIDQVTLLLAHLIWGQDLLISRTIFGDHPSILSSYRGYVLNVGKHPGTNNVQELDGLLIYIYRS